MHGGICPGEDWGERVQDVVEQEGVERLGRNKSEGKASEVGQPGNRNGYGKPRRFTLSMGSVEVRGAGVRNVQERFSFQVLPLFKRQSRQVRELLPELYWHGVGSGDFELGLRGLVGAGAPLSAFWLLRFKEKWEADYEQWEAQGMEEEEAAYLWADGIDVKAGIGKEKAALVLVVMGAMRDGSKRLLALEVG